VREVKVLAVASGGGHWTQLLRLAPAFEGHDVSYVTVNDAYRSDVPSNDFHVVRDATRWNRFGLLLLALQLLRIVLRERPRVVISTGAAPGLIALAFGKLLGARTIWVDSLANVDELSLSGRLARRFADLWLTQWPHLATANGPLYAGTVF
jgi:UDP-N-acetylglucosamine:LPS N-acetylglucosamine transferase